MNNANDKLNEHFAKESLKQAIDNNYNFTNKTGQLVSISEKNDFSVFTFRDSLDFAEHALRQCLHSYAASCRL